LAIVPAGFETGAALAGAALAVLVAADLAVDVARLAASADAVPPVAAIMVTFRRTRSAAMPGSR